MNNRVQLQSDDRLLTRQQVCDLTGIGKSSVYRFVNENGFPPAIQLGARCVRWRQSEVLDWIETRPRAKGQSRPEK